MIYKENYKVIIIMRFLLYKSIIPKIFSVIILLRLDINMSY
jgi:hypothetical protein